MHAPFSADVLTFFLWNKRIISVAFFRHISAMFCVCLVSGKCVKFKEPEGIKRANVLKCSGSTKTERARERGSRCRSERGGLWLFIDKTLPRSLDHLLVLYAVWRVLFQPAATAG